MWFRAQASLGGTKDQLNSVGPVRIEGRPGIIEAQKWNQQHRSLTGSSPKSIKLVPDREQKV